MEGTRKNVWSEYKELGKWGFVPKLGVTLLAALIILSLSGCKNTADGGVGSSGGGGAAPSVERDADGKGVSLPLVVYTFKNDDGNDLGTALLRGEQSFGEIKSKVADISVVESVPGFRGWVVNGDTTLIKDEDKYSSETTFVATYSASASSVIYTFKNSDGATLGTTILRGEQSFGEIKSKVADVSVVESVTGFLGWVVDGDTTLIKNENKYSSETTFVAKCATSKADIDLNSEVTSFVWYNENLKETFVFDDQQVYIITGKDVKVAQATIAKYLTLEKLMYSVAVTDPLYNTYKIEKEKAQAEITDDGVMWIAGKDTNGNDLVSLYTNIYYRFEDYNMDIAGRKLTRTTDGLVYVRQ